MMAGAHEHSARFDELLPAYALGALDGDELRELDAHMATGCAECQRQAALWQGNLEELATAVEPIVPPAAVRERVLRAAAGAEAGATVVPFERPRRTAAPLWLALAASLLLVVAAWGVWQQTRLRAERDNLARQVASLESRLDQTQADNRRLAKTLSLITAPGAHAIQLAGLGPAQGAVGHAFVNPRTGQAVIYAFDLPAPAAGKTYQLWWIAAGRPPVPAGTFGVDEHGAARVEVERVADASEVKTWAVTIEPAGGLPQPSGPIILKG
jgi:anti-sigma-K factor RskA